MVSKSWLIIILAMLKHFKIKSSLKNYEIFFTSNFKIITKKNNCIVICDSFFKKTFSFFDLCTTKFILKHTCLKANNF